MDAALVYRIAKLIGLKIVNCILYKTLNIRVMERTAGLVTGLEIYQLARSLVVASTASEHVTVLIPTAQQKLVGLRNIERLRVKLLVFNKEVIGNTCKNRVSGIHVPDYLALISAPGKVTR